MKCDYLWPEYFDFKSNIIALCFWTHIGQKVLATSHIHVLRITLIAVCGVFLFLVSRYLGKLLNALQGLLLAGGVEPRKCTD